MTKGGFHANFDVYIYEEYQRLVGKGNVSRNVQEFMQNSIRVAHKDVDDINEKELDILSQDGRTFYEYSLKIINNNNIPETIVNKYLSNYKKYSNAIKNLQLCIDAQIMVLYNFSVKNGLANGTRLEILTVTTNTIFKFKNYKRKSFRKDYYITKNGFINR